MANKNKNEDELITFLRILYIPSSEYIATVSQVEKSKTHSIAKETMLTIGGIEYD